MEYSCLKWKNEMATFEIPTEKVAVIVDQDVPYSNFTTQNCGVSTQHTENASRDPAPSFTHHTPIPIHAVITITWCVLFSQDFIQGYMTHADNNPRVLPVLSELLRLIRHQL